MSHHVWNWSKSTQNSKCQELPWLLNTSLPPAAKKNQWNVLKIYIFCRHMLQMLRKKTLILMALYPNLSLFFKKPNSVWSRTTFRTCTAVVIEARYSSRVFCLFIYLLLDKLLLETHPSFRNVNSTSALIAIILPEGDLYEHSSNETAQKSVVGLILFRPEIRL